MEAEKMNVDRLQIIIGMVSKLLVINAVLKK
jgi:hypothetical protein